MHPVDHIDFGSCAAATYAGFMSLLPNVMKLSLEDSGFACDDNLPPAANFLNAIAWHFKRGRPCVVLIDEYDDPVAKALANSAEAELVRNELAAIYGRPSMLMGFIRREGLLEIDYESGVTAEGRHVGRGRSAQARDVGRTQARVRCAKKFDEGAEVRATAKSRRTF